MSTTNPQDSPAGDWLLDALSDGVVLIAADWRVLFANQAAERLLHIRRSDVVGRVIGKDLPEPPEQRMSVYRDVMLSRSPRMMRDVVLEDPQLSGHLFDGEVHPSPSGGIALVFRDITERRRAEQAVTRLGRILESSWNEIYIFGADTLRFSLVSKGALENLGYSMEEMQRLTPADLLPEFDPDAFARLVEPLRTGEQEQVILEAVHRRRDGSQYPVEMRLQLARAERPGVLIAVTLDITDRRRAQEQLEAQAMELEVLNEELRERTVDLERALATRNRFYAAMSHELRTPINAVIGYNDLILGGIYGALGDKQRQGIERSQRAARHLLEIVDDVLDISRLEAGKVQLQPERVEITQLLEDLAVTAVPLAQGHGAALRLKLDACRGSIVTDPRRVRQILLNLISNAAKFGDRQPVELRCSGGSGQEVVLEVHDRGAGIAPEDQERIFEEFVQLREGDNVEGTGLGLAISRHLAGVLGGRLEVESTPGKGTTFRLRLPSRLAGVPGPQPVAPAEGGL